MCCHPFLHHSFIYLHNQKAEKETQQRSVRTERHGRKSRRIIFKSEQVKVKDKRARRRNGKNYEELGGKRMSVEVQEKRFRRKRLKGKVKVGEKRQIKRDRWEIDSSQEKSGKWLDWSD